MNAKLCLHFRRSEWHALLLHVSYIRRFYGRRGKTYADSRLSLKRIPNETARRQSLTAVETLKKPTNHHG